MPVPRRIYISMPADKWCSKNQNDLKWEIVKEVELLGYIPEVFTSNTKYFKKAISAPKAWTAKEAYEVARRCSGAILIGLPRWTTKIGNDTVLFPSEFCHYEGALFKSLQLPTMVLAQSNIVKRVVFNFANEEDIAEFDETDDKTWLQTDQFRIPFDYWKNKLYERRDVFLGYCSSSTEAALAVKKYLSAGLGLTVLDWQIDFSPTDTILDQIQKATARCTSGIFLFTKDDVVGKKKDAKKAKKALPRDNVVFEAGYFMAAKGNAQVLIILETGAKMPADLGGKIYAALDDKNDIKSIKPLLKNFAARF